MLIDVMFGEALAQLAWVVDDCDIVVTRADPKQFQQLVGFNEVGWRDFGQKNLSVQADFESGLFSSKGAYYRHCQGHAFGVLFSNNYINE